MTDDVRLREVVAVAGACVHGTDQQIPGSVLGAHEFDDLDPVPLVA